MSSEPERLRAFVNGTGVTVARGATILDAVREADAALADAVAAGTRAIADSRGLVVPAETVVTGGAVLRVVSARARRADSPADADEAAPE